MRRGLTLGELVVVLAVLILCVAITVPIYHRAQNGRLEGMDTDRMREIYLALSLYQTSNDGAPSPNLLGARTYLGDATPYLSDSDPWANLDTTTSPWYPVDPEMPALNLISKFRVSYSYLLDFVGPGKNRADKWAKDLVDPRIGLLSSDWHGTVTPTGAAFTDLITGPVLRVNTDGLLYRLGDKGGTGEMGDWNGLFYKR